MTPEKEDDILKAIYDILQRGNNAEIRLQGKDIIVLEVSKKKRYVAKG